MTSITIVLFDDSAARIKESVSSPTSNDSEYEERIAPFTTSPLDNCRCISSSVIQNYPSKVRDGHKKHSKGQKGKGYEAKRKAP